MLLALVEDISDRPGYDAYAAAMGSRAPARMLAWAGSVLRVRVQRGGRARCALGSVSMLGVGVSSEFDLRLWRSGVGG